ncbi:MAG TPA: SDR family NAD(P)-dependent oxidoreductase, partial [Streptosporangiaceae bacterium]
AATESWRYQITWTPASITGPVPDGNGLAGRWLIVAPVDGHPLAAQVAAAIATHGGQARVLIPAGLDRAALTHALAAEADGGGPLAGVISLLAVPTAAAAGAGRPGRPGRDGAGTPGARPGSPAGTFGTLTLIQALGDAGAGAPLWVLTRGAVRAGPGDTLTDPVQAQVWGLGRVAALEHPDRWGGLIDLPPVLDERATGKLCGVLAGISGENETAVRAGAVLARRLARAPQPRSRDQDQDRDPDRDQRWEPSGTVLVTGGTGAIGTHVAHWLAGQGTARLILASRSGPAATGAAALAAELAQAGVAVTVARLDTTERPPVAGLRDWIQRSGPSLRAVFHTAGVLDDGVLDRLDEARLAAVLEPKAAGASILDELTRDCDLDAFVLFSSAATVFGSAGQGSYAAANAHLDALAEQRRARGLAGTSIAWGPWAGAGLAGDSAAVRGRLARGPLIPLKPALAIRALGNAIGNGPRQVAIMDIDWPQFVTTPGAADLPLLRGLPEARPTAGQVTAAGPDAGDLTQRLAGLAEAAQLRVLTDMVRADAAAVLGHPSSQAVPARQAFRDLGFDSLAAVELRNQLAVTTHLNLPATLIFDHPTPEALAGYLRTRLVSAASAAPASSTAPAALAAAPAAKPDPERPDPAADGEPIAIVSMSCRFPGGVSSPEDLWDLLSGGTDAVSEFPADRGWDIEELHGLVAHQSGAPDVHEGGFVYDADRFDAGFFGISPREALAMDPQQRLLLEVSWEALERAGIAPHSLRASPTGVFTGTNGQDYATVVIESGQELEGHLGTGNAASVMSGRIAYTFGLEGPAVSVDTACSSSLVALHLACQALRSGECSLALAGGATVMATSRAFADFSQQQGLAADGRCKAFSAAADGTGWAEGAGMLLVERLADARRNGHPVLAVIRGSAVNQDGASNGLTAPNGPSQQRVIRSALASAGIAASDVDAVEAHGTGTVLGDPIEAQALLATYGQDRPADQPVWLGSVKSNLGHTQAAAGVAGVIKMVLALQHAMLPPTLHVDEPSPHVDWSAGSVRLLTESRPWPAGDRPRRAGISAFGISGTNAHTIIEAAPAVPAAAGADPGPAGPGEPVLAAGAPVWLVSGRTAGSLTAQVRRLSAHLTAHPDLDSRDLAWSLATTRPAFEHRAVVTGDQPGDLVSGVTALAAGTTAPNVITGTVPPGGPSRIAFVFPGQGSQWAGMGRELATAAPVFAARLAECGRALAPYVDWSLEDVLAGAPDAPALESASVVQPALWAVMVALAATWQAAGVTPDAVAGHSQGEIAAACVAGILTLDDAAAVVALRSAALTALAGQGGMLSIAEPVSVVRDRIAAFGDRVSVAAVNGPAATVVSGDPAALETLAARCTDAGTRTRMVAVDYASHSPQVEAIRERVLHVLDGITPQPARVPMVSAMTGELVAGPDLDARYWYDSLRAPVEFSRAVGTLARDGFQAFIEVSPHPVLISAIAETFDDPGDLDETADPGQPSPVLTIGTLRRDDGGPARLVASLAEAHTHGVDVNWAAVLPAGRRVSLPTYAFQRDRYWPDPHPVAAADAGGTGRWRYRAGWTPVTVADPAPLTGTWLVLAPAGAAADAAGLADWCARELGDHGATVVTAETGPAASRPAVADQLRSVLAAAGPLTGIVSLLALAEAPVPAHPAVTAGLAGTLALVQAAGDAGTGAPVWALTRGAVATSDGQPVSPAQAQVWGLGRVVALEQPGRWGGLIDLPPEPDERTGGWLRTVLSGCSEDQVAIRPAGLLARRLVRAPAPGGDPRSWTPRGTVLITGGTGAIAGHAARWVSSQGAPHVALVSRSGPAAPGVAARAARLAAAGTRVTVGAGDISDRAAAAGLLGWIARGGPPLSTVLHTAGVGQSIALDEATAGDLDTALAPKAAGAAVLDELTQDLDLDAFVLFSSIAATWGSGGQPGYAAANAFLDALAEQRLSRGRPAVSVAWGMWGGGGMSAGEAAAQLARRGLRAMDPEPALAMLKQALDNGESLLTVADVDWARFTQSFTVRRPSPLIGDLPEVRLALAGDAADTAPAAGTALGRRLAERPRAQRLRMLTDLVRTEAAAVLGHRSADAAEPRRAFRDLGFDSLTAVDLRKRLSEATGLRLPSTLVFDHPTPVAVAEFLLGELTGVPAQDTPVPVAVAADEPVAVVAMGCRYPGGVRGPDDLWDLIAAGTDAVAGFPPNRGWDAGDPGDGSAGPGYARAGGFVYDAGDFDAGFFGISPREALAMDPQQRLLLEVSWEAIERAGIAPESLRGSSTGVFAGASFSGYGISVPDEATGTEGYLLTGTAGSVISGRVAYTLGLEGPAVTVDTACSSSLVALHLACQ